MSTSGANEDEMGRFLRLSDEELSRLLAGEAGVRDEAFEGVVSLLGEVREVFAATAPADETRELHLAAIAEASRLAADKGNPVARPVSKVHGPADLQVSGLPKWRRVMDKTIGLALKAVAATVAASMSMVGLAYAGVDLPGQAAERALEAVTGLELPNQGSEQDDSVADEVRSVLDGDLEGCELGQAVADAVDANRQDGAEATTDPCEQGENGKATGEEKSAAGRAKAVEKSAGRSESGGSEAATEGRETATDKSSGASDSGADNAGRHDDSGADDAGTHDDSGANNGGTQSNSGADNAGTNDDAGRTQGSDASSSGQETGSTLSEEGQATNPTGDDRP